MDMQKDMKALNELNKLYGVMQEKAKSAGQELAQKEKDDDALGAPNKKGKVKRWWDDDGDGKGYEKHEVKKTKKEEVEKRPEKLPEMKALNQLNKLYTEMQSAPVEIDEKESYKTVAAVIDYDRSKKGTDDAVYDTEHGKKKQAKKERDYAAWERSKMKRDDPDWKHKKGSTSESLDVNDASLKGVTKKEVKNLQKAAVTGKGKYVKKADQLQDDKKWGYDKKGNSLNPVDIMKKKRKDDDLAGAPNKVKEELEKTGLFSPEELENLA